MYSRLSPTSILVWVRFRGVRYGVKVRQDAITIYDSYLIRSKQDIRLFLSTLQVYLDTKGVCSLYVAQTKYLKEWWVHSFLYRIGLFRKHTKNVDFEPKEKWWRRAGYAIIYTAFNLFSRRKF